LTNTHMGICRKGKGEQNMNRKIVKLSSVTLTLIMVLGCLIAFHSVYAQAKPKLIIDPAVNTFYTNQTSVGATFTVSIKSADFAAPGVFSYQIKLLFDNTMLQATAAGLPTGHWLTPASSANIFVVDPGTINNTLGFVSFGVTLLGNEAGKTGGGTIATVTFSITASPSAGGSLTSSINLGTGGVDTLLVDPNAVEIPASTYDLVPATFTYASPPLPKPFLSVNSFTWDNTAADAAGRLFNVSVLINSLVADWRAIGFQFTLSFDGTILATQQDWIFAGDFAAQFGALAGGTFNVSFVEGAHAIFGEIILPPWPDPTDLTKWAHTDGGSGTLAIIQFNATYRPPPEASSDLVLSNIQIVDFEGNLVQTDPAQNGLYTITVAPPPWLSVLPSEVELDPKLGSSSFNFTVQINQLDKGFQMVGAEFKVFYNTSILSTTADQITEGTNNIMREVATRSGTDLFFQAYLEEDHGLIGIIILPLPNGTWPFFPEGAGTLAAITFTVLPGVQEQLAAVQPYQTTVNLGDGSDVLLVNANAKPIPTDEQKTATEGVCTVTIKVAFAPPTPDRVVDLFTQYNAPFGGQGANVPSDAFAPQGQVQLFARVTYRNDTVPGKPVAYQVIGPNGLAYDFAATEFTDSNGVALLPFTMPASSLYFGVWTIKASVDVAGQVVSDTLTFRFGWLIEAKSTTITPNQGTIPYQGTTLQKLYKGSTYTLAVALKIITMQHPIECLQLEGISPKTLLVYSGVDELKQPLFNNYVDLTASIGPWMVAPTAQQMQNFVADDNGRTYSDGQTSIKIPSGAFSGVANIYAMVYTDYPWIDGVPYFDPAIGTTPVWIQAPAAITPPTPTPVQVSKSAILSAPTKEWTNKAANDAGRVFSIDIKVGNIDPTEQITGIQFALEFDPNIINVTAVIEGSFVKTFGPTFFTSYIERENSGMHVLVGQLQLPPYPGALGWMTGGGTICTITFNAVYSPPPIGTSKLNLKNALLVDSDANPLQFKYVQNGYYLITP
jgi:hypothetical protein